MEAHPKIKHCNHNLNIEDNPVNRFAIKTGVHATTSSRLQPLD